MVEAVAVLFAVPPRGGSARKAEISGKPEVLGWPFTNAISKLS